MRRKRNPTLGNMFQIYVSEVKEDHIRSGYLLWEGYGGHKPWNIFEAQITARPNECLTLYVYIKETGVLEQLAQYWHGEIEHI